MKFQWLKHLLEKVPPGVSISLPGVSVDPGSLAQYFADEDDAHKDEILAEITNLRHDVGIGFQTLRTDLEPKGIDTKEKFDELLGAILQKYANIKQIDEVVLPPSYDDYLKFLIDGLNEWQRRYAPMFAKFKDLTLFARVTHKDNSPGPQELVELIHQNQKLVIIGPAGAGKTTTIKKVALDNASNFLRHKPRSYIPIIVPLRDYGAVDLKSIIGSILKPWKLSLESIEPDLLIGKFLIIFDGLNEVPTKFQRQCFQEIRNFTREYRANRCLYTARNFGYQDDWVSIDEVAVPVCEIEPLTKEQIEDYIRRYFGRRKELAEKLVFELKLHDSRVWENRSSLARLAGTPLLLQMLILTFEEKRRIPKSEGELLLRFVDEILLKWEPSKSAAEIDSDVKKSLLATIAWEMQQRESSSIDKRRIFPIFVQKLNDLKRDGRASAAYDPNQIWQELQNNHLVIEDGDLIYWPHPLYQELFVGLSLCDICFDNNWEPIFKEIYIQFHSIDTKWYGDPSFEAGLRMLEVVPQPYRLNALVFIATVNPSLAKEAFQRFEPEYNPGLMDEFTVTLRNNLLSNNWEGVLHSNLLAAASYISAEHFCSLFLDAATLCPTWEGRNSAITLLWSNCRQIDYLSVLRTLKIVCSSDTNPHVRKTAFNILILSDDVPSEEVLSFLAQRLFDENQGFLSDPQLHLIKLLDSEFVVTLLNDFVHEKNDRAKILRAIWCLGESKINSVSVRKNLIGFAKTSMDEEIRSASVNALAAYPSDLTIKILGVLTINDSAKLVRLNAINSLYTIGGSKVLSSIISALDDMEEDVANKAVVTLVDMSEKEKRVANRLLRDLRRAKSTSRLLLTLARVALKEIDPKIQNKICKELRYHRNEPDKYIRMEIALALRNCDMHSSNEILRDLYLDKDPTVRRSVRELLNEWEIEL